MRCCLVHAMYLSTFVVAMSTWGVISSVRPFTEEYHYDSSIMMHSIVNGMGPVYLRELVQPASLVDSRPNLRSSDNCTSSNCALGQNSRNERSVSLAQQPGTHSTLPTELRLLQCKDTFKRRLKTFYFNLAILD